MEGLEVSEVNFLYIEISNNIFRIDSNFFQKKYLEEERAIRKHTYATLRELGTSLKSFGAYSLNNQVSYIEEGIPFIRGVNMKEGRISFDNMIFIDKDAHALLWKSEVKPEMVLLSMSGTIGDVAIASKAWNYPINSNQDIAKIDTRGKINPHLLYVFLLSKYGQSYLTREARGSVQQHVFLSQIEQFEIPFFTLDFTKKIEKLNLESEGALTSSEQQYRAAEELLLEEIGLKDFEPSKESVNIKSFSSSFAGSGRLDAEYYQPKYEQVMQLIATQAHDRLANLVFISKSIEPGSMYYDDEGLPFLRVADYTKFGITEPQKCLSDDYIKENKKMIERLKPKKDTILFSKDGSVGTAYCLREDKELVTSGAILHLRVRDRSRVVPQYLTLVLNSEIVQLQAARDAGGSIILHWRVSEIENVTVPIVEYKKQEEIAELIEESFKLKKQSEDLLERAKRAVEMAIEESEDAALAWLDGQV